MAITEGSRVSEFWTSGLLAVAVSEKEGMATEEVAVALMLAESTAAAVVVEAAAAEVSTAAADELAAPAPFYRGKNKFWCVQEDGYVLTPPLFPPLFPPPNPPWWCPPKGRALVARARARATKTEYFMLKEYVGMCRVEKKMSG